MIELLGRVAPGPSQISPYQAFAIISLALLAGLFGVGLLFFEGLLYRIGRLLIRLARQPLPTKSPARVALEDLERRVRRPGE